MKNNKFNFQLALGFLLLGIANLSGHIDQTPHIVHSILVVAALIFELWGIILIARSPAVQNSRLGKWKRGLIQKNTGSHHRQDN